MTRWLTQKSNLMNTSQQINHVFGCDGQIVHVHPGFKLLMAGNVDKCPTCGASMQDITGTPLGQAYFAFHRPDLGAKQ